MPTINSSFGSGYQTYSNAQSIKSMAYAVSNTVNGGTTGSSYLSANNTLSFPYDINSMNLYTGATGRAMGVRAEYMMGPLFNGYPNAPWSIPPTGIKVNNQTWNYSNMLSKGYVPGQKYETSYIT
jgi:hypothetical protein